MAQAMGKMVVVVIDKVRPLSSWWMAEKRGNYCREWQRHQQWSRPCRGRLPNVGLSEGNMFRVVVDHVWHVTSQKTAKKWRKPRQGSVNRRRWLRPWHRSRLVSNKRSRRGEALMVVGHAKGNFLVSKNGPKSSSTWNRLRKCRRQWRLWWRRS